MKQPGWHPEDIKAAVRKKGVTLTALALRNGLSECYCRLALIQPAYRAEQVIAEFLQVPAQELWPDRYDPDGTPRHPRIRTQQSKAAPIVRRGSKGRAA